MGGVAQFVTWYAEIVLYVNCVSLISSMCIKFRLRKIAISSMWFCRPFESDWAILRNLFCVSVSHSC